MGGRCWLVKVFNSSGGERPHRGPSCTDNFQYIAFDYKGKQWMSVEQCFQAQKFNADSIQERIRLCLKTSPAETDHEHGMRVWSEGRRFSAIRVDWDQIKIDEMFNICWAKYQSNPKMQVEFVDATEGYAIQGNGSTGWNHPKLGEQNWSFWNGKIQEACREMCKPEDKRNMEVIKEFNELRKQYYDGYL